MSRDPQIAAHTMPAQFDTRVFDHPQEAVDFARQWVREFQHGFPRAKVKRGPEMKRVGARQRLIFSCWMKFDGTVTEERIAELE